MNEKIVTSQAELDAIPVDYSGRIIIKFGIPAKRAVVNKKYLLPVEAHDNSSVCTYGNSSVCACNNSSVEAHDNSSVRAYGNSSVRAYGNSQVVDAHRQGNIMVSGNARIVYNPDNIADWASANGITITDGKIRLYKAVHKRDGKYVADWDNDFIYTIGAVAEANGFTADPTEDCGQGIHMATLRRWLHSGVEVREGMDKEHTAMERLRLASDMSLRLYKQPFMKPRAVKPTREQKRGNNA